MTPEQQEFRDEAERLALLPVADQKAILAMHRADARNPKVPKPDRDFARRRAAALERYLRQRRETSK
jgi:hypothetical protein